jgi:hydrogenase nickel incorporation protein HypA/HybF
MHEWALADSVIEATSSALGGRPPSSLRSVTVVIGELQAIDREIFDFALKTLLKDRPFAESEFRLVTEAAAFRCTACAAEWGLADARGLSAEAQEAVHFLPEVGHAFIRCPTCGSPDYRVQKGRGVYIESISVDAGKSGQ